MRKTSGIDISPELYLQLVGTVFVVTGLGLFFYCILCHINIWLVETFGNPLFYLCLGLCCICFSFFVKRFGFIMEEC